MALFNVQRSRFTEIETPHTVVTLPTDPFADVMVEVSDVDRGWFEQECNDKGISYE